MVNVCDVPEQFTPALRYCGVTVTVETRGFDPELDAVNEFIVPLPLAAKPMLVRLFVQV